MALTVALMIMVSCFVLMLGTIARGVKRHRARAEVRRSLRLIKGGKKISSKLW